MNYILNFPLTLFFAVLPSFAWLNYYLKKDVKPEPKIMILKIFFGGMIVTLPTIYAENFAIEIIEKLNLGLFWRSLLGVAFIEEFFKFLVVKELVFVSPELEEPVDTMIYMIVAALGFAASENIFLLFPQKFFLETVEISFLRFVGATLLHALSSAIVGFYTGLSFFRKKERVKLITFGLLLASLLHGFYNFSIIEFGENFGIFLAAISLFLSACFVSFSFKKLKE
jgi:RsiW-degrading membrane proteinase PrsW (M82 family)